MNLLGSRETSTYGTATFDDIKALLGQLAKQLSAEIEVFQSNHEGALIDKIQSATKDGYKGILINPAAYGHTSIALRDALLATALPFVEVHISNIYAREEFRHKSLLSDKAAGVVLGFGPKSYLLGLRGLVEVVRENAST